jgi:hypothetical protein
MCCMRCLQVESMRDVASSALGPISPKSAKARAVLSPDCTAHSRHGSGPASTCTDVNAAMSILLAAHAIIIFSLLNRANNTHLSSNAPSTPVCPAEAAGRTCSQVLSPHSRKVIETSDQEQGSGGGAGWGSWRPRRVQDIVEKICHELGQTLHPNHLYRYSSRAPPWEAGRAGGRQSGREAGRQAGRAGGTHARAHTRTHARTQAGRQAGKEGGSKGGMAIQADRRAGCDKLGPLPL